VDRAAGASSPAAAVPAASAVRVAAIVEPSMPAQAVEAGGTPLTVALSAAVEVPAAPATEEIVPEAPVDPVTVASVLIVDELTAPVSPVVDVTISGAGVSAGASGAAVVDSVAGLTAPVVEAVDVDE